MSRVRVVWSFLWLAAAGVAVTIGWRCGRIYERNLSISYDSARDRYLGGRSRSEKLALALEEALGLVHFHSTSSQDKWIAKYVYPKVRDGYFVDVGCADGVNQSNTKALEDLGWKGICIDPFPTNMGTRTCKVFREVVHREAGKKVSFRDAGFIGGIDDLLNSTRDAATRAKRVEFETVTLDDILARAGAPHFIHYMSIDIEGAELEALRGLSFSKYRVGAFTIEHNFEEPKRTEIRKLLEGQGYRFVVQLWRDDCYLSKTQ
jgi:FkbM family methyltransferase